MLQVSYTMLVGPSRKEMNDSLCMDSMNFEDERQNPPSDKFKNVTFTSPTDFSASIKKMRGIYCTMVFTTTIAMTDKKQHPKDIQNLNMQL